MNAILQVSCNNKTKKNKNIHTMSQVTALGYNCFQKLSDLAYANELTQKAPHLYPQGVNYDPDTTTCAQANVVTRKHTIPLAHHPRSAFVLARLGRPENFMYETQPEFSGWPTLAIDDQRGRSLQFGETGGALGEFERSYGGEQRRATTPLLADLLHIIARINGRPLDQPPATTAELDSFYGSRMSVWQSERNSRRTAKRALGPRTALDFYKQSVDHVDAAAAASAFKTLAAPDRARYASLAAKVGPCVSL